MFFLRSKHRVYKRKYTIKRPSFGRNNNMIPSMCGFKSNLLVMHVLSSQRVFMHHFCFCDKKHL